MIEFDEGKKLIETVFSKVPVLSRFYLSDGMGYTRGGSNYCYDDHTCKKIFCNPEDIVYLPVINVSKEK